MSALLLSLLFFAADEKFPRGRPSALQPAYRWDVAHTCDDGLLLVRQPVYPGRLSIVRDLGCALRYLDVDGRRVDTQIIPTPGGDHRVAVFAAPLEWGAGHHPAAACMDAGCAALGFEVGTVDYPKSEITVAKKFATPPKSEAKRIAEDRVSIDRAFKTAMFDADADAPLCAVAQFDSPFVLPRPPDYTSVFGALRVINKERHTRHLGTDFDGRVGEPILATGDGTVVLAKDLYYSGNSVFVSHGFGLVTTYFHMTQIAVKVGEHVRAGQLLGSIGRTGRVTGPHLHFSAKLWGTYFEPTELFELFDWLDDGLADTGP